MKKLNLLLKGIIIAGLAFFVLQAESNVGASRINTRFYKELKNTNERINTLTDYSVYHDNLMDDMSSSSTSNDKKPTFYSYNTKLTYANTDKVTGDYPDLVVQVSDGIEIQFARATGYLPKLVTKSGFWAFTDLYPNKAPDTKIHYTYARVIEETSEKIVVHWRYYLNIPKTGVSNTLDLGGMTNVVHEVFTFYPDLTVQRKVRNAADTKYQDWVHPNLVTSQSITLTESGLTDGAVNWGATPPIYPRAAFTGNTVKTPSGTPTPALSWNFDDGMKEHTDAVNEGKTNTACNIEGLSTLYKKGVSGTALAFDGYSTKVTLPQKSIPAITNALTIEAWIAADAYPWGNSPITHQSSNLGDKGFYLGVDPHGYVIFTIDGTTAKSDTKLPLNKWAHVVGTYDGSSIKIYLNASAKGNVNKSGNITSVATDLLIGMNNEKKTNALSVRGDSFGNIPFLYGFQGLIDEVNIYASTLTDAEITTSYNNMLPTDLTSDLKKSQLPGIHSTNNTFGITSQRLSYGELWDHMWRDSDYGDMVVTFENNPGSIVFWRGTDGAPSYVTDGNKWMADQSCESSGESSLYEHMSDKQNRFSHVKVLENTPARKRLLWRYGTPEVNYVLGVQDGENTDAFAEELITIYPDGTAVRKVLWFGDLDEGKYPLGFQDIQVLKQAGEKISDVLEDKALSIANYQGTVEHFSWANILPDNQVENGLIEMVNFKGTTHNVYAAFQGGHLNIWGENEQSPYTTDNFAGPWNHWPVAFTPSDGRWATGANDRLEHFALCQNDDVKQHGAHILYGITDKSINNIIPKAKSWKSPPSIDAVNGATSSGYDKDQGAFLFAKTEDNISFSIKASSSQPIENPCFVIKKWNSSEPTSISMDGTELKNGSDYHVGIVRDTDGSETLIITVMKSGSSTSNFNISASTTTTKYTLTVTAVNGSVSPSTGSYIAGSSVTLTATPNAGFVFEKWTGDATGTQNPITVVMDSNKNITANFKSQTTSINNNTQQKIKIYPNPAHNTLNIDIQGNDFTLNLYNVYGQKLLSRKNSKTVDVSSLQKGTYFIEIKKQEFVEVKKLQIN